MNSISKNVFRLIIFRLIIITSLLISAVIIQYSTSVFLPISSFYYLVLSCYFLSVLYLLIYFFDRHYIFQVYLQIFIDLLIITALVYISGGLRGSFYFLYIFEIIAASLILSKRAAYLTASLCAIFFGMLVEGMFYKVIPIPGSLSDIEMSFGHVITNILIAWSVFFIIAFLMNSLSDSLRKTREKLREAEKELEVKTKLAIAGETSAKLAHEIRNPLTAVSGSVQLLKQELNPKKKQKELMDIIINESQRISYSIDQYLNLVSPGEKASPVSVDLSSVVKETLTLLKMNGKLDRNIQIGGNFREKKLYYFGDIVHFKQIFWNLLSNSIKAMPDGGTIDVDFNDNDKNKIQLKFADTGKGMSPEEKEKIFEPFYSGFQKGKGIGMAVVKQLIDEYKGDIEVLSEPNRGTEIILTFPKNPG
ncbi:MAG: two-component system sensor histidine kinase NtrB [Candidatus Aminicenantaceae bacterium]